MANYKIEKQSEQISFWQNAHTSIVTYHLTQSEAWETERIQWQKAVDSRDDIIEWYKNQSPKIETVTEIKKIEIIKEVPIEIIKEVEKTIYPQRFDDVDTAKEWILSHTLPIVIFGDRPNNLINNAHDPRYDCDDYADDYESLALSDNISLWQCPVTNGYIWGVKVSKETGNHVGLWTKINDTYYYIEPQPINDELRFIKVMDAD